MTTIIELTPAHKRRLSRLAREAGCEPQDLLDDVFKFGFDFVERDIRETSKGVAEIASGAGVPHGRVMTDARSLLERHGRKQKSAA
jgi:predicted transcriptional regulator